MSFLKSLVIATGAAIGTAAIIDKSTDGAVRDMLHDWKVAIFNDPTITEEAEDSVKGVKVELENPTMDILWDPDDIDNIDKAMVIMPLKDALRINDCFEDMSGNINPDDYYNFDYIEDSYLAQKRLKNLLSEVITKMNSDVDEVMTNESTEDSIETDETTEETEE